VNGKGHFEEGSSDRGIMLYWAFLGRGMDFSSGYSNADFVNTAIIS